MKRGWLDYAEGQILLSFICGLLFFLIVMAAEFLHTISDGATPQLIKWQPAQKRQMDAESTIKYVGEEDDDILENTSSR